MGCGQCVLISVGVVISTVSLMIAIVFGILVPNDTIDIRFRKLIERIIVPVSSVVCVISPVAIIILVTCKRSSCVCCVDRTSIPYENV